MQVIRTASMRPLTNRSIAVLGFGSQGRAQALNLRDKGFAPVIGLPSGSHSRQDAKREGFCVTTPARAVARGDIILVLAPDHLHGVVYEQSIRPQLRDGQTLVFAHASSVHFGLVKLPRTVDVILVAPLGPGKRLRDLRGKRDGIPCFWTVHQDYSGRARALALALARAIGCIPAGAIETTFADEAVGDLFGEQAVLCGGLGKLLTAGVSILVRHGLSAHAAYLECVYQLDLIVDLIKSDGLAGMYARISPTAAFGARRAGPMVVGPESHRAMEQLYGEIATGEFFRTWVKQGSRRSSRRHIVPTVPPEFARGERTVLSALKSPHKT